MLLRWLYVDGRVVHLSHVGSIRRQFKYLRMAHLQKVCARLLSRINTNICTVLAITLGFPVVLDFCANVTFPRAQT